MTSTPVQIQVPGVEIDDLVSMFNSGRYGELECRARLLLESYPNAGIIWKVLGTVLQIQRKDSLPVLQRAAELLPDDAETYFNLGVALYEQGRYEDAVLSYRRAFEIRPTYAEAANNLGNALRDLQRFSEAIDAYRSALGISPDYAEAHSNLGSALRQHGQFHDAVASLGRALAIKPDYAKAHFNLGIVSYDLGRLDDAIASYRRALIYIPDYAEVHCNLGSALYDFEENYDAVTSCHRALAINPRFAEAYYNLGNALKGLARDDEAVANYKLALLNKPDFIEAHGALLFMHHYRTERSGAILLNDARKYGALVAQRACPYTSWIGVLDANRRLRIGLVSGDFKFHAVGLFLEGVLVALATQAAGNLEFIAYHTDHVADALTEKIKTYCHEWHSVDDLSDEDMAARIRDDGIDILIDLSGHTKHNRLPVFAWKPAPVQATWLGYFATTGVAAIDYLIADPWTAPNSADAQFTEKVWRLPETRLCFTPPHVNVTVSSLPALVNGHLTFACFNNLSKMNDAVVALWTRILHAAPESRLFLKSAQLASDAVRQRTMERFSALGIAAHRLILDGPSPRAEYLAAYQRVDIALDPFPYPGGTTSVEALWMGVPVLTLTGERFLERQGVGILNNAGLSDWIAADADDYVARALGHASDLQRLAALRSGLREQVLASPIFDASRFARHFETALREMWRTWCLTQKSNRSQ